MPLRVETERLILRCWERDDAEPMVQAVTRNLDHLRPWLPWAAHEPESVEKKIARIERWQTLFRSGRECNFGIFTQQDQIIGAIGVRGNIGAGAASIGYWIDRDFVGRGLMTEAVAAMTRLCFDRLQLIRCEIHCEPTNLASAAIARKLGYTHVLTIPRCVRSRTEPPHDTMFWVLLRSDRQMKSMK